MKRLAPSSSKNAWSSGKVSGTVQTGYIKVTDLDLLVHHSKSIALSHQVDEIEAQGKIGNDLDSIEKKRTNKETNNEDNS